MASRNPTGICMVPTRSWLNWNVQLERYLCDRKNILPKKQQLNYLVITTLYIFRGINQVYGKSTLLRDFFTQINPRPHMGGCPPGRFCALYATFLKLEIWFFAIAAFWTFCKALRKCQRPAIFGSWDMTLFTRSCHGLNDRFTLSYARSVSGT